jgi:hypothetical protein
VNRCRRPNSKTPIGTKCPGGLAVGAGRGSSEEVSHRDLAGPWVGLDGSSSVEDVVTQEGVERFGVIVPYPIVIDVEVGEERLVE